MIVATLWNSPKKPERLIKLLIEIWIQDLRSQSISDSDCFELLKSLDCWSS